MSWHAVAGLAVGVPEEEGQSRRTMFRHVKPKLHCPAGDLQTACTCMVVRIVSFAVSYQVCVCLVVEGFSMYLCLNNPTMELWRWVVWWLRVFLVLSTRTRASNYLSIGEGVCSMN